MSARVGDLELLDHPVAQRLLSSTEPAQLAYSWLDGTPRTIPIWFHWDGEDIVLATPPRAPKLAALRANPMLRCPSRSMSGPTRSFTFVGSRL